VGAVPSYVCRARVSRRWDSAIAVLGGNVPTWKANKARLLVGGHQVGKLGFRHSRSHCAATPSTVEPKALPSRGQDRSCRSTTGTPWSCCSSPGLPCGQSWCVCVQMRWQHMFADSMPALPQAPAGILLSAELIGVLFNNPLFYPFHRVKHALLFMLINGCAGQYLPTLLRK